MTDFSQIRGFEDLWRPPARRGRSPHDVLGRHGQTGADAKARLARVVSRTPEVMVKITGKTKDGGHLQAHLAYISREGSLPLEGRDGERLETMAEIRELGADWAAEDQRKRADASMSVSIVLSMPAGTDQIKMRDAARQFALETFGGRFDYVFALHTDVDHPHVHLAVRSLGQDGERLNPRKADLEAWRQTFARTLRDRGIAAEATPRRARGIVRKAERMPVRKLRERYDRGEHPPPRVLESALKEAEAIAQGRARVERPWEPAILQRQRSVREAYRNAAQALAASDDPADRALADRVAAFAKSLPPPATLRNELVREFRKVRERGTDAVQGRDRPAPSGRERDAPRDKDRG